MLSVSISWKIFIFLAWGVAALRFRVSSPYEGCNAAFPKKKRGKFGHGEDSLATTPFSLVVSDGVGGCTYTSKHWSELITYRYQKLVKEFFVDKQFVYFGEEGAEGLKSDPVPALAFEEFAKMRKPYNQLVLKQKEEWDTQNDNEATSIMHDVNVVSATIIGAWIDPRQEDSLHVMQMGDSLLTVFNVLDVDRRGGPVFYYPTFWTPEMRKGWNYPHQYPNVDIPTPPGQKPEEPPRIDHLTAWVEDGSIVLLGSDGLYDNMHVSTLTILMNLLVHYHTVYGNNQAKIMAAASNFMKAYARLILNQFEVVQESLKSIGFSMDEYDDIRVKDPDYEPPRKSLWDILLFRDFNYEDATVTKKELRDRHFKRVHQELVATAASPLIEGDLLTALYQCDIMDLLQQPWKSGRTVHYMRGCPEFAIRDRLAVTADKIKAFQRDFDTSFVSTVFAHTAKFFSEIEKNYASPFYIEAVEAQGTVKYPSDGKADDISAIAAIVEPHSEPDLQKFRGLFATFEKAEKDLLARMQTELPKFFDMFFRRRLRV